VVKNCGAPIHQEVIKRSFLEQLKDRIQGQQTDQVGQKILEMIQTWGIAGRSKHEFKLAADLYNIMKVEGYQFPEAVADNELIVDAAVAPVWKEGDECFRCKVRQKNSRIIILEESFFRLIIFINYSDSVWGHYTKTSLSCLWKYFLRQVLVQDFNCPKVSFREN